MISGLEASRCIGMISSVLTWLSGHCSAACASSTALAVARGWSLSSATPADGVRLPAGAGLLGEALEARGSGPPSSVTRSPTRCRRPGGSRCPAPPPRPSCACRSGGELERQVAAGVLERPRPQGLVPVVGPRQLAADLGQRASTMTPFSVKPVPSVHLPPICRPTTPVVGAPAPPPQFHVVSVRPPAAADVEHAQASPVAPSPPMVHVRSPTASAPARRAGLVLRRELEPPRRPRDDDVERLVARGQLDRDVEARRVGRPSRSSVAARRVPSSSSVIVEVETAVASDAQRRGARHARAGQAPRASGAATPARRSRRWRGRPTTRRPARGSRRRRRRSTRRGHRRGRPVVPPLVAAPPAAQVGPVQRHRDHPTALGTASRRPSGVARSTGAVSSRSAGTPRCHDTHHDQCLMHGCRSRVPLRPAPPSSLMIMATHKRWSDLSGGQRAAIIIGSVVETILTSVALADLARRPRTQVRGPRSSGEWLASLSQSARSPISSSDADPDEPQWRACQQRLVGGGLRIPGRPPPRDRVWQDTVPGEIRVPPNFRSFDDAAQR